MCVGQETLYACGHKIVVPMVVYVGETTKCPCLETSHALSGAKCHYCVDRSQKQMFRATNPRAAETEIQEEVGERRGRDKNEGDEDEYQLVCERCKRGNCGKCGRCACCKERGRKKEEEDRGDSSR